MMTNEISAANPQAALLLGDSSDSKNEKWIKVFQFSKASVPRSTVLKKVAGDRKQRASIL